MKRTVPLKVIFDSSLPEWDVQINPNDGFDLGLMTTDYPVSLVGQRSVEAVDADGPVGQGRIFLRNEVANNTVILSTIWQAKLGEHPISLFFKDGKLGFLRG